MPIVFEELCCRCEYVLRSLGILAVSLVVAICDAKERKKKFAFFSMKSTIFLKHFGSL
jgi:hypothetical protein